MAKRKITVTVDEHLVETVRALGPESLSSVVNAALAHEVDRRARAAALGHILADWDAVFGPVSGEAAAAAAAAFDDLDAIAGTPDSATPDSATPDSATPASATPVSKGRRRQGAA